MSFTYNGQSQLVGTPAVLEIAWTFTNDATETTIPLPNGFALELLTNPDGSIADNWDIVVNDSDGADVLRGVGADRDQTTSERAPITLNGVWTPSAFSGALSFASTNTSSSGGAVAKLYCRFFPRV